MSTPFTIRYLQTAEADLEEIFDYIVVDNPPAAVSILEKFDHAISRSAINPEIGADPKDDRLKKLGYRVLIIGNYLVFYVVKSRTRTVQIRRIVHGARQYSFLL